MMLSLLLAVVALLVAQPAYAQCQARTSLNWAYQPNLVRGLAARIVYNGLQNPRGIKFDLASNLLVVERGVGIIALTSRNSSLCQGWERTVVIANEDFNHGIELNGTALYASTADYVQEYIYDSATMTVAPNVSRTLVTGMRNPNAHDTRTLLFQPASGSAPPYLIVSRGADENIEPAAAEVTTGTAQIRRFALNGSIPSGGYNWLDGEVVAYGVRNAVGMAIDRRNKLWAVENSADQITWRGQDVHLDNPSDELNMVDLANITGAFYGFPNCFTAWNMTAASGPETGAQFTNQEGTSIDDTWCSNTANVVRPALNFQAHSAPLDIKFYHRPQSVEDSYALSDDWEGDAFVSFHGSWNRQPPTGYGVVRIRWSEDEGTPDGDPDDTDGYEFIIRAPNMSACPSQCIRPVGLDFDPLGRLFVSSDTTGEIFLIEDEDAPDAAHPPGSSSGSILGRSVPRWALVAVALVFALLFG